MARDRKDRSASWFMTHHGGALLRLAPVGQVIGWHAAQTVLGFPKQIPDGLLDVTFASKPAPDPFLVEIETYPDQDTLEQVRKDVAMVLLTRGVLSDVLLLVLCPKGNLMISEEQVLRSAHGLTELRLRIHVVHLWTVPAEQLLAAGDVGLIPWVPLAQYAGAPAALLEQCRERIEQQARPQEKDNLLAMTQVMAEARYNDPRLLGLLGGMIMSPEKAMLKLPAVKRFIEERERKKAQETEREAAVKYILRVLHMRFGSVPEDLVEQLRAIQEQTRLDDLLDVAAVCPDLEAFRQALNPS